MQGLVFAFPRVRLPLVSARKWLLAPPDLYDLRVIGSVPLGCKGAVAGWLLWYGEANKWVKECMSEWTSEPKRKKSRPKVDPKTQLSVHQVC